MSEQRTILCVLTKEQRAEYKSELDGLRQSGIKLVFQDDAEKGLEQAGKLDPHLVLVGMELGPMEGLEFLAFFIKRYPTYTRTVVVLPSKDDPFPPMAHSRDPSTGRSEADEITFTRIAELAQAGTAPTPAAPTPSPDEVPAVLRPPVAAAQAHNVPQKRGKGWLVPVIAVVAVAAIGGVAFVALSGNGDQPPTSEDTDVVKPRPKTGTTPPTKGEEPSVVAQADPDAGAAQASPDTAPATKPEPKEPTAATGIDLKKMTALPFSFGKASARPDLTDAKRLGKLLKALGASAAQIEVGGHTSNEGAESYNQELGRSRAEAVRDLLAKRGIPEARIRVRSYGGRVPIASNATEEGRRKNRRVTVRLRP